MGDGRGGYQAPKQPAAVSGPGRLSKRTDGGPSQPLREPDLDQEGVQYGDRKTARQMHATQPIRNVQTPDVAARSARPSSSGRPRQQPGGLSSFIFGGESRRPDEAITQGLGQIAEPPDDVEEFLTALAESLPAGTMREGVLGDIMRHQEAKVSVASGGVGDAGPVPLRAGTPSGSPAQGPPEDEGDLDPFGDSGDDSLDDLGADETDLDVDGEFADELEDEDTEAASEGEGPPPEDVRPPSEEPAPEGSGE